MHSIYTTSTVTLKSKLCDTSASAASLATCGVQNQVQVVCIDAPDPQYLVDSVQSVAESSRRPGLGPPTLPILRQTLHSYEVW